MSATESSNAADLLASLTAAAVQANSSMRSSHLTAADRLGTSFEGADISSLAAQTPTPPERHAEASRAQSEPPVAATLPWRRSAELKVHSLQQQLKTKNEELALQAAALVNANKFAADAIKTATSVLLQAEKEGVKKEEAGVNKEAADCKEELPETGAADYTEEWSEAYNWSGAAGSNWTASQCADWEASQRADWEASQRAELEASQRAELEASQRAVKAQKRGDEHRKREQWRDRPGHPEGGRYGNKSKSENTQWHTQYHLAKNKGEDMKAWEEKYPRPNKKEGKVVNPPFPF
jgi:hypothetical protein